MESLQDVPISITAVSGDTMAENGIFKIEDLQTFTPNLSMTETGISTQIYVRGIGTGNNQGFEQSIGMYIDGIYMAPSQFEAAFLSLVHTDAEIDATAAAAALDTAKIGYTDDRYHTDAIAGVSVHVDVFPLAEEALVRN